MDGAVSVGPPSNKTSTAYLLEHLRKPILLANDADVPALPTEFHWLLPEMASAIGQRHNQDPTAVLRDATVAPALEAMRRDYLSDAETTGEQWG